MLVFVSFAPGVCLGFTSYSSLPLAEDIIGSILEHCYFRA